MTNNPSAEKNGMARFAEGDPGPGCSGIQFDRDEIGAEEQQMETTKRIIWEKLVSRLEIGSFDLMETEQASPNRGINFRILIKR